MSDAWAVANGDMEDAMDAERTAAGGMASAVLRRGHAVVEEGRVKRRLACSRLDGVSMTLEDWRRRNA